MPPWLRGFARPGDDTDEDLEVMLESPVATATVERLRWVLEIVERKIGIVERKARGGGGVERKARGGGGSGEQRGQAAQSPGGGGDSRPAACG